MARGVPIVVGKGRFGSMIVVVGPFGWWWSGPSKSCGRGFCVGVALTAENGSPTTRPFALRHKRYVKQAVLEKSKAYLDADRSYEEVLRHEGMPIQYHPTEAGAMAEGRDPLPRLASSTLWRWLSWLGGMPRTLRSAWKLIREKDPENTVHREVWALLSRNGVSERRPDVLQRAMQWIVAEGLFAGLFGQDIFPHFAIAHGWS